MRGLAPTISIAPGVAMSNIYENRPEETKYIYDVRLRDDSQLAANASTPQSAGVK